MEITCSDDIVPELQGFTSSKVVFRKEFEEKISNFQKHIIENGSEDLLVISDFDLTLTAPSADQCHHMFGKSPLLPDDFKQQMNRYLEFEVQCSLDDWWVGVHNLLIQQNLTQTQISHVVQEANAPFRDEAVEFLNLLNDYDIPIIIISAGVTDMILTLLENNGVLHPNIHVASNKMVFDENEVLVGFEASPYITTRNKELAISRFFDSASGLNLAQKHSVVAVGDKPSDVLFLKKYENAGFQHSLTLGFRDKEYYSLEEYFDAYDVTCLESQSFALYNGLIRSLLSPVPAS